MKIGTSFVNLDAGHQFVHRRKTQASLNVWVGPRPGAATAARGQEPPRSALGHRAPAPRQATTEARPCGSSAADVEPIRPATWILKALTEMLTGRPVETFDPRALQPRTGPAPAGGDVRRPPADNDAPAGFGIEYQRVDRREERETLEFSASGRVTTADGREIGFELGLRLERRFVSESSTSLRAGDAVMKDPLVINFDGRGAALDGDRIEFDIDADGDEDSIARLAAGSGYLVLDGNGNGRVDDGSELFGPASGDGLAELARHDDDGNGWIDGADAVFERLSVWRSGAMLQGLADSGVGALYLGSVATPFRLTDAGNGTLGEIRDSGIYLSEDGRAGALQQIDVAV